MKKILFVIFLLPTIILAKTNQDSINNLVNQNSVELSKMQSKHDEIEKKIIDLRDKHDYQVKQNDQTLSSISSQIGAASYNLTIFGILFTVAALGVGVYITFIERKILAIREENKALLKESITAKDEVVLINDLIHKDIYGLFLKIKREETVHILKRLINIPEDISNLSNELLSRELEETDFSLLKKAYLNLRQDELLKPGHIRIEMSHKDKYLLLFFQHFTHQSIIDEDIKIDFINFIPRGIDCSFEIDIIKSTKEFIQAVIKLGFLTNIKGINNYFEKLSDSKHKNLEKLYETIFNTLETRDRRFDFYNILDNQKSETSQSNFGKLLIKEYETEILTNFEIKLIDKAKSIIGKLA